MTTSQISPALSRLFSELVDGASQQAGGAFILNSGDAGLLRSLDKLSGTDASRSSNGGATIAAHAQHVRYGLSLMNRWATEGGNPFADAKWDEAWRISAVDDASWAESGARIEASKESERVKGDPSLFEDFEGRRRRSFDTSPSFDSFD